MIKEFLTTPAGIAAVAAAIVALLALLVQLPKMTAVLSAACRELRFWVTQRHQHDKIEGMLEEIVGELRPNHGGSIKDSVNRIENRLDFLGSFRRAQLNTDEIAFVETDANGDLCWANKRFITLMNVTERDLLGTGWVNVIHPDQRDWVLEHWREAVEDEREFRERVHYQPHNAPSFWAHVICHPVRSDSGKLFGYLAEVHPIRMEGPQDHGYTD